MKEIVKEVRFNVYRFDELRDVAKASLIEREKENIIEINYTYLEVDLINFLLNRYGIKTAKIYYDLSGMQGSGVCFECDNLIDYKVLQSRDLKEANAFEQYCINSLDDNEIELLIKLLKDDGIGFRLTKEISRYTYASTCQVRHDHLEGGFFDTNDWLDDLCEMLFDEVYMVICEDLKRWAYAQIDVDQISDYEALEDLDLENTWFYEDGSIYSVD